MFYNFFVSKLVKCAIMVLQKGGGVGARNKRKNFLRVNLKEKNV